MKNIEVKKDFPSKDSGKTIQSKIEVLDMDGINLIMDLGSLSPIIDGIISSLAIFSSIHSPPSPTQSDIIKDSVGPMLISDK